MRLVQAALAIALLAWAGAWWQTRTLPPPEAILPELLAEPKQGPTTRKNFGFEYRGLGYEVRPVASYELYGLVVSHNDIHGIADIYHDDDSVDTKDLCVIWGANLERDDYRRIAFENTPTWCHWSWRSDDIRFSDKAIANNHLVTDDAALRAALARVHVGDQVRFSGLLADYRDLRHPEYWRPTSRVRTDSGPIRRACDGSGNWPRGIPDIIVVNDDNGGRSGAFQHARGTSRPLFRTLRGRSDRSAGARVRRQRR